MDFDCCSTLNRKKEPTDKPKKYSVPSDKKEYHPETVKCSNIVCNVYELPFINVTKLARVGKRYHYFCNEFCYLEWLKGPTHLMWI